jgi:hypothetical protein
VEKAAKMLHYVQHDPFLACFLIQEQAWQHFARMPGSFNACSRCAFGLVQQAACVPKAALSAAAPADVATSPNPAVAATEIRTAAIGKGHAALRLRSLTGQLLRETV